jgi:molybdopterin adenylyltransferase
MGDKTTKQRARHFGSHQGSPSVLEGVQCSSTLLIVPRIEPVFAKPSCASAMTLRPKAEKIPSPKRGLACMTIIDESRPFIPVHIAVLTMSDTRNLEQDKSGNALVEMIAEAGHVLADRALVKDDVAEIRTKVKGWLANPSIDVIITTGGTGFTGRDVTPEAIRPLFEKEIDAFSMVFHLISFQKIATSTIQSRACAGVANGRYIFCLPGSPGACKDAWNGILKWQLDNRQRPCNFVEIMPRLQEHRYAKGR